MDVTRYLNKLLTKKGYSFTTSKEKEVVRDIKEQTAFVADSKQKKIDNKECMAQYKLPSEEDEFVSLDIERWQCCEVLFDPKLIGVEEHGLDKVIFNVVMRIKDSDAELKQKLFANIVLCGASSVLPGLDVRIQNGLKKLVGDDIVVEVANTSNHEKKFGAFIGASLLSERKDFLSSYCMSKDEYDEEGPVIVHKQCVL